MWHNLDMQNACIHILSIVWFHNLYFGDELKAFYIFKNTGYNYLVMTTSEWAQFILTICSILAIAITSVRWYIRTQTKPIYDLVQEIRNETQTNGGSSMRDEIKSIKAQQFLDCEKRSEMDKKIDKSTSKIDHMYDVLLEYIASNKR
jgi:hypothetical protein